MKAYKGFEFDAYVTVPTVPQGREAEALAMRSRPYGYWFRRQGADVSLGGGWGFPSKAHASSAAQVAVDRYITGRLHEAPPTD